MPHLSTHEGDLEHGFGTILRAPSESEVDVSAHFSFDDVLQFGDASSENILL
jgi:hypothetical protein